MLYYINGYGVPDDIGLDGNYERYLSACAAHMGSPNDGLREDKSFPEDVRGICFAGGATDPRRPHATEAEAMYRWFKANGYALPMVLSVEGQVELVGNLRSLRTWLDGDLQLRELYRDEPLTMFCEHARQDFFRFLAWRLFPGAKVVPIRFAADEKPWSRLRHALRLPLRIAAFYSPAIREHVDLPRRLRFLRQEASRRTRMAIAHALLP